MADVTPSKPLRFDRSLFQKMSLVPFFAFVGLGADALSSSCYGPEEAYVHLGIYRHLILFVGLMAIFTIWAISTSYCQIIDLFPHGGGGYVVASKLLNPTLGLVSGCALLVDYVLTMTISVASGIDAIFSILPAEHAAWKFFTKMAALFIMMLLNFRGVKESVFPWVPIFILFLVTHLFAVVWAFISHSGDFVFVAHGLWFDVAEAQTALGTSGLLLLILKSYSVGAGTYTGIEAISNGINIFRPPRAQNAKITMFYMGLALALTVSGLIFSYLLYYVTPTPGVTLNGVLMHQIGSEMGVWGPIFAGFTLITEAALLVMAAQSGFLSAPRVLANMAADRWLPNKFTNLSDRFVMRHGLLLISAAALALMVHSGGSVSYLVVLYSLAVFITFSLSQFGMVLHWAKERRFNRVWLKGVIVNGIGFVLAFFILISLAIIKFEEGGWLTLLVIACLVGICKYIRSYYTRFASYINQLPVEIPQRAPRPISEVCLEPSLHTAVFFVSGYSNLILHTIAQTIKILGNSVENFVFIQVGIIDAGTFKGGKEIDNLEQYVTNESLKLVKLMQRKGYTAESHVSVGLDIGDEVAKLAPEIVRSHPSAIFIGGQVVLPKETTFSLWLHNQTLFALQRRLYEQELPYITLPVYVSAEQP